MVITNHVRYFQPAMQAVEFALATAATHVASASPVEPAWAPTPNTVAASMVKAAIAGSRANPAPDAPFCLESFSPFSRQHQRVRVQVADLWEDRQRALQH